MPRRRRVPLNYGELMLNRTVGLEIEGYMKKSPRNLSIENCSIKRDGSLSNYWWSDDGRMYGVEVVTKPLDSLTPLGEIFEQILEQGWSASGRASLHVHVDAQDFTFQDRLKLAQFAKCVEDVMFLFVKNRRYNNQYCRLMPNGYKDVLSIEGIEKVQDYRSLIDHAQSIRGHSSSLQLTLNRYQWANIFKSHYNTIEFRLFHPIRKAEDGAKFAYLVHNFVNLVKSSSHEQLAFIAQSIQQESNIELKAKKLLDSLGIDFELPIINERAKESLEKKMLASNREMAG
ncbi:amidoligase family protein [Paenibacillus xylanexedens]|uniref:amidoligase family protein n=1 Tax=Paenibacillus xylanexedens TaxID=528191 RepID=UPI000F51E4AB|nr:amidoligase family protein [Paenibacillus xylanexedens]RPK20136.1 hypothetical protein EDO6_06675 [Paenibacillus xylanexedens]